MAIIDATTMSQGMLELPQVWHLAGVSGTTVGRVLAGQCRWIARGS
jgi:hypothetical protein